MIRKQADEFVFIKSLRPHLPFPNPLLLVGDRKASLVGTLVAASVDSEVFFLRHASS